MEQIVKLIAEYIVAKESLEECKNRLDVAYYKEEKRRCEKDHWDRYEFRDFTNNTSGTALEILKGEYRQKRARLDYILARLSLSQE